MSNTTTHLTFDKNSCFKVFNEHPSRIISLEMIARLVAEAEDSLKHQAQVDSTDRNTSGLVYLLKVRVRKKIQRVIG